MPVSCLTMTSEAPKLICEPILDVLTIQQRAFKCTSL